MPGGSAIITDATAGGHVIAASGNARVTINHAAARERRTWRIPLPSAYFTGQEEYLKRLDANFPNEEDGAIALPTVLQGQGGIGKTELALAYAHRFSSRYDAGHFIVAESLASLHFGIAQIAEPELATNATRDQVEALRNKAYHELGRFERVLVIFDNVDDIAETSDFKQILSKLPRCHVILTCRHREIGASARQLDLDKMDEETGALYVLRLGVGDESAGRWAWHDFLDEDTSDALLIARELDGLPLALHHAGWAIRSEALTVGEVLADYRANRSRILGNRGKEGEVNHPLSAQLTVTRALERLREKNPAAAELVVCCAFLAPDAIAEDLFTKGMVEVQEPLASQIVRFPEIRAAALATALIGRVPEESRLSIHRVTQLIIQDDSNVDAKTRREQITRRAVLRLAEAERLAEAYAHADFAVSECSRAYGDKHADTLLSLSNAAFIHSQFRNHQVALEMLERVVALTNPKEEPNRSLLYCGNLAEALRQVGRFDEALEVCNTVLTACENLYGPEHQRSLESKSNLAVTLGALGRHLEAVELQEQVLAAMKDTLGNGDKTTLTAMANLALTYRELGRATEEQELLEEALVVARNEVGEASPLTLRIMENLAETHWRLEHIPEAVALRKEVLLGRIETLGEDHPETLESMTICAAMMLVFDDQAEALRILKGVLEARRRLLGDTHPSTLESIKAVASAKEIMAATYATRHRKQS